MELLQIIEILELQHASILLKLELADMKMEDLFCSLAIHIDVRFCDAYQNYMCAYKICI